MCSEIRRLGVGLLYSFHEIEEDAVSAIEENDWITSN